MASLEPPEVITGSLTLQTLAPADWTLEQQLSRDPEVARWTYYPTNMDEAQARRRLERMRERTAQGLLRRYTIRDDEGRALGTCGLGKLDEIPEISYAVLLAHRGRGVATTATSMLATWALTHGAAEVALETIEGNVASERVAARAGFVLEAIVEGEHRGRQVHLTRWVRRA